MNIEAIYEALAKTEAGEMTFPEVVGVMVNAGVESYFVDLVRMEDRFYMTDGSTHIEKMGLAEGVVAMDFSQTGVIAAIRGAQADTIRYPEFVKQAKLAGAAAYWAFLTGRKVVYFGRKGEFHVEEFPATAR